MDLTTLAAAVLLALGLLATDTVINAGSVAVEVAVAPKIENVSVDGPTLEAVFENQLDTIVETYSVVSTIARPEIRSRQEQGVGMALAEQVNARRLANALQRQLGYKPDTIRFTLFSQDGALRGFVSGESQRVGNFDQVMTPDQGETVIAFTQRCSLWAASQLAPYSTALYLLQKHSSDMDFTDVVTLVEHAKALLPPTNKVLLATAYMIWGAARIGLNDLSGADRMLATSTEINPQSATAFALWAEMKSLEGNQAAADRLNRLAGEASATFENYEEVAALYFHLAWADKQPVTRNKFTNPRIVTFH